MSILRLCLYTMRLNLQFRWFPHTKECLWEITRCYIFNSAKHSNLKAEEVEFTVWRTVKTGDTSQLIKWLPAGEKSKYRQTWMTSPEPILQPTNDLYPLLKCCSHYKTTIEYTLHLHKSFSLKQRQVSLEGESKLTIAGLTKMIILGGGPTRVVLRRTEGEGLRRWREKKNSSKFSETKQACSQNKMLNRLQKSSSPC